MLKKRFDAKAKTRNALTLIEAGLVLVILGVVVGGAFMVVPKMMANSKSDAAAQQLTGLIAAVESIKSSNGGANLVQAAPTPIPSIARLTTELGGTNAVRDIAGWTYRCPLGSSQTLTIVTSSYESSDVRDATMNKFNGRMAPWVAAASGTNALTITRAGTTCQ